MVQETLPHEILLNILYHLDGDEKTINGLLLTCKLFRALLIENQPRIAYTIARAHRPGPIRFLLESTAPIVNPPSFPWLSHAYYRGHAIELLVNAFENVGLYKDASVFGTAFSRYGRPLVPADYADVRRYVMTMLLAVELCSVSSGTRLKRLWARKGPRWTAGLALQSQDLIRHLDKSLYRCIDGHNALTWGPSDEPSGWFPSNKQAEDLASYLCLGMILSGSAGIVDILSTTNESYNQFVAVARRRLYGDELDRYAQDGLWPQQQMPRSLSFLDDLKDRNQKERLGSTTTGDSDTTYKDYVSENDIDEWKKDVPDDEAWIRFVHNNKWSKALQFQPNQLRKKTPEPLFKPLLDMKNAIWSEADANRIVAQPLAT